jgi:hypothetical protein
MEDKFIDLAQVAPGVYDLDYIHVIQTDAQEVGQEQPEDANNTSEPTEQEWIAFYRYDVVDSSSTSPAGPFGAAIYGLINCRPASILSYELVPVGYNYLGEDWADVQVENVLVYADPVSVQGGVALDRPEVMVRGFSRGVVTDLNFFRKTGVQLNCQEQKDWEATHPDEAFPNAIRYDNVGSFHGNYLVKRNASDILVVDRTVFERSQITVKKKYQPVDGSYFQPGTQVLREPVEYSLGFGPGEPQDIPQVYYPEKAVLAFYLALGEGDLAQVEDLLSEAARGRYDVKDDPFGLSTDPDSVARARDNLGRVLVWELGYAPNPDAERLRQDTWVTATVVGVSPDGQVDTAHPCQVRWKVVGEVQEKAIPYGCEWRLDEYQSTCQP